MRRGRFQLVHGMVCFAAVCSLLGACTAGTHHVNISSADPAPHLRVLWARTDHDGKGTTSLTQVDGSGSRSVNVGFTSSVGVDEWDRTFSFGISPDGRFIARTNRHVIEVASSDSPQDFHSVVDVGPKGGLFGFLWSPDSTMLAYRTIRGLLDRGTYAQTLWVVNRDGSGRRALRSDHAFYVPQIFDLRHNRLFMYESGGGGDSRVTAVSLRNGKTLTVFHQIPIFPFYEDMIYTADFSAVYYVRWFPTDYTHPRLYRFDLTTRTERVLQATQPDGKKTYIGSPIHAIPGSEDLIVGSVSGPYVAGAGNGSGTASDLRFDPASDSLRPVFADPKYPCRWRGSVSPDGRFLMIDATTTDECSPPRVVPMTRGNVLIKGLETGSLYTFFDPGHAPCTTPSNGKPGDLPPDCGQPLTNAFVIGWLVVS